MIIPIKDSEIVTEEKISFGYFYIISHKTSKVIAGYLEYEEGDENDTCRRNRYATNMDKKC